MNSYVRTPPAGRLQYSAVHVVRPLMDIRQLKALCCVDGDSASGFVLWTCIRAAAARQNGGQKAALKVELQNRNNKEAWSLS